MIDRYTHPLMARLISDSARYRRWAQVEIAVMDHQTRKLDLRPTQFVDEILEKISSTESIERIQQYELETHHDVQAFIRQLRNVIDDTCQPALANWVHQSLTSSDVVDTAMGLLFREACKLIRIELMSLNSTCAYLAHDLEGQTTAGRTHGQVAIPIQADERPKRWVDESANLAAVLDFSTSIACVGTLSGPVGKYHWTLTVEDEREILKSLGLGQGKSSQIVPRWRYMPLMNSLVMIGNLCDQIATDIRLLAQTGIDEVSEGYRDGQTASSSMPHKTNTAKCEQVCGIARLLRANYQAEASSAVVWLERDISHSSVERVALIDSLVLAHYILHQTTTIVGNLQLNRGRMQEWADSSVDTNAQLIDAVRSGEDRMEAWTRIRG